MPVIKTNVSALQANQAQIKNDREPSKYCHLFPYDFFTYNGDLVPIRICSSTERRMDLPIAAWYLYPNSSTINDKRIYAWRHFNCDAFSVFRCDLRHYSWIFIF